MKAVPLGNAEFKTGITSGEHCVSNFRFTAGTDLLKGAYEGYATTEKLTWTITENSCEAEIPTMLVNVDPRGEFKIACIYDNIFVTQTTPNGNDIKILQINSISGEKLYPLIAFKYCMIEITFVGLAKKIQPKSKSSPTLVSSGISFSAIVSGKKQIVSDRKLSDINTDVKQGKIESVKNLTSSLQNKPSEATPEATPEATSEATTEATRKSISRYASPQDSAVKLWKKNNKTTTRWTK